MMKIITNFRALLLLPTAMILASCLPSENPLSAPEKSKPDSRLIGEWVDAKGNISAFAAEEGPWMKMSADNMKDLRAFPTVLGKARFLNVKAEGNNVTGYLLIRYEIGKDGALTFFIADKEWIEEAIRSGEIKGEIKNDLPKLTDTTENIVHFIEKHGAEKVFSKKGKPLQRKK